MGRGLKYKEPRRTINFNVSQTLFEAVLRRLDGKNLTVWMNETLEGVINGCGEAKQPKTLAEVLEDTGVFFQIGGGVQALQVDEKGLYTEELEPVTARERLLINKISDLII